MGILSRIFEKRDLSLTNPKAWNPLLWNLYGSQSKTGININEHNALQASTVYRCTKLIADTVASLPLKLYEKGSNGGKTELSDRRIIKILKNPNSEQSHFRFFSTLQGHLFLWGNCFLGVTRDNLGRVLELWPIRPDIVQITRDEQGKIIYLITTEKYGQVPFTNRELLHIPGFGFDGLQGYSIVHLARESIGLGLASEEYGARYFGSGHHPGIVIKHPGKLSTPAHESLKQDIENKYGGLGNAHKAMLLEEGMDLSPLGMNHDDAQFLQTRQFQNIDFCRFAGVPPHMAFELDRAIYNNIEHQGIEWVRDGVRPWVTLWEQEFNRYFLNPNEYGRVFFEFTIEGLLRGDITSRYTAYGMAVDKGWMNRNEVRSLENLNPGPEELNEFTVQMNMSTMEKIVAEPEPVPPQLGLPPPEEEEETERAVAYIEDFREKYRERAASSRFRIQESFRPLFRSAAQSIVNRETAAIKRAITANFGERAENKFNSWLDEFYKDMPAYMRTKFLPVLLTYAEQIAGEAASEIGAESEMTPELEEFVSEYMDRYSERHISSSVLQLRRLMDRTDHEEIADSLRERIDEWSEKRSDKIAINEATRMNGAITREVFIAAGITRLTWVAMGSKPCPYCRSMDGKTIGIIEAFVTEGNFQPSGQDPMKIRGNHFHPPLHGGCVCGIVAGA